MSNKAEIDVKVEALTEMVKAHMQRFDNTRKIQWTFNGLFWSGIIISAPFLRNIQFYPNVDNRFLWFSITIMLTYSIVLYLFQRSLEWDKNKFKHYRRLLEKMIRVRKFKEDAPFKWATVWGIIQLIVTGMLLFGVYQILL